MNTQSTGHKKVSEIFLTLLFVPSFFPFIGFFEGIDIQPIAFLCLSIVALLSLLQKSIYFNKLWASTLILTLLLTILRFTAQQINQEFLSGTSMVLFSFGQTLFHLLTLLVAFIVVSTGRFRPSSTFLWVVLLTYGITAAIQLFYDEGFASSLVYRGFQELASSGRGARSLASEPASFAYILLVLSGFFIIVAKQYCWSTKKFISVQFLILCMSVFLAQSIHIIFYQFSVFILCAWLVSRSLFIVLTALFAFLVAAYVFEADAEGLRVIYIFQTLIQDPALLYEQGAMRRVLNVPISLYAGILHGAFGSGFNPQEYVQGSVFALPGYPYPFSVSDRNMGGLVELFLRTGIIALPLLGIFFIYLYKATTLSAVLDHKEVQVGLPLTLILFLTCFTYGSIGNPLIWLLFFYTIRIARSSTKSHKEIGNQSYSMQSQRFA